MANIARPTPRPTKDASVPDQYRFGSRKDYWPFAQQVKTERRFIWSNQVYNFLENILGTKENCDETIGHGTILWRAQLGVDYRPIYEPGNDEEIAGEEPMGISATRMTPIAEKSKPGRLNTEGIPVLYLASSKKTAISEVRPWAGSLVSVAQFEILRDLKAINLTATYDKHARLTWQERLGNERIDPDKVTKIVWSEIDDAFAKPVSRSESRIEYIPTQILAELFAEAGYDAVIYRSSLVANALNVAVFDLEAASIRNCTAYEVTKIDVKSRQAGSTWYVRAN